MVIFCVLFFFFKQKTAYEMRISDWSSDVCSSDLLHLAAAAGHVDPHLNQERGVRRPRDGGKTRIGLQAVEAEGDRRQRLECCGDVGEDDARHPRDQVALDGRVGPPLDPHRRRSEEHTSELQSLMRSSYAVFCLKKNNHKY